MIEGRIVAVRRVETWFPRGLRPRSLSAHSDHVHESQEGEDDHADGYDDHDCNDCGARRALMLVHRILIFWRHVKLVAIEVHGPMPEARIPRQEERIRYHVVQAMAGVHRLKP